MKVLAAEAMHYVCRQPTSLTWSAKMAAGPWSFSGWCTITFSLIVMFSASRTLIADPCTTPQDTLANSRKTSSDLWVRVRLKPDMTVGL